MSAQRATGPTPFDTAETHRTIAGGPRSPASRFHSIESFDEIANAWVSRLAATALTATGTKTLLVGPELVTAANAVLANMVPQRWRVVATLGNANSHTYHVVARVIR